LNLLILDLLLYEVNKEKKMSRKIIYLLNPRSGTQKKVEIKVLVEKETNRLEIPYEILHTNVEGKYGFVKDKIEEEGFTDVVMIGGDGTVNQVTNALRGCNVNFGIIPVGSGNGLARAAHIPLKTQAALALVFTGKAKMIDAFMVNEHYSCMLSGVGFDAQVAHDFATKASRGLLTYTQQSILNYFKAQPYQFEIIMNDMSFFSDAFFISVANSNQFGNNFTIAPKASLSDGLLDIVIVQKMNKAKLPFAILQQMRGNNKLQNLVEDITKKNILYFQTPTITIKNPKLAPLHIDGEPYETSENLKISIIKDCFKLIH
jgi:YegS/Rv2252/BmrU family lipid kinase